MKPWMARLGLAALGLCGVAHAGTVYYDYTDPQGNVLAVADAQGHVVAKYDYAPYGAPVASLGSPPNGPGYTGHVNDPETGLVYMQARYYVPVGRFPSPDPVGVSPGNVYSVNRYAYANNNPIINIDPDGRSSTDDICMGNMECESNRNQVVRLSYSSSQGDIFHVTADALAADTAWLYGWATGNKALQQTAIEEMQKEFNGRTAGEAIVSLLMTTEGGEDSFEMQEIPSTADGAVPQGGLNLFKWGRKTTTTASGWNEGDYMLNLPDKGSPAANWAQNSSWLRREMSNGKPIFDSHRDPITGEQIPTGGFLNAERNLLDNHGWRYNPQKGAYLPPER